MEENNYIIDENGWRRITNPVKIPKPGYTQVPNPIFEATKFISANANRVLIQIAYRTFYINRGPHQFSIRYLMDVTGIEDHKTVTKAVKELTDKGYLPLEVRK